MDFDKEKAIKLAKMSGGGGAIVALFLYFHSDLKAEIRGNINRIVTSEKEIVVIKTLQEERAKQLDRLVTRFERALEKLERRAELE